MTDIKTDNTKTLANALARVEELLEENGRAVKLSLDQAKELIELKQERDALAGAARAYLNSDTPDPRDQDQVDECEITRDALAALIDTKGENNA